MSGGGRGSVWARSSSTCCYLNKAQPRLRTWERRPYGCRAGPIPASLCRELSAPTKRIILTGLSATGCTPRSPLALWLEHIVSSVWGSLILHSAQSRLLTTLITVSGRREAGFWGFQGWLAAGLDVPLIYVCRRFPTRFFSVGTPGQREFLHLQEIFFLSVASSRKCCRSVGFMPCASGERWRQKFFLGDCEGRGGGWGVLGFVLH